MWPETRKLSDSGIVLFRARYSNRDITVKLLSNAPGDEYVEFSRFWHESDPDGTMAFPGIFGTIKQRSNARFPPLVDED